jgi:hypothetical protein
MATKQELYDIIESSVKQSFTKGETKGFVHSVGGAMFGQPRYFKKGDVIANGVGAKKRPCVVIKVEKEFLYLLPLSSTEDELNLCESHSRFFADGWFTRGVSVVSKDYAVDNFIGVYDNIKLLNKAIKLTKQEIQGL